MDVVVAGGGLAGLVAALQAAELGARVTLLEKGDRLGGSFLYSSGYIWSYKDLRTFRKEAPGGDVALQRLILERLETDLDWLEGLGAPALTRATDNPLSFGAQFGAERVVATLSERIVASGGRLLVGTALNGLVQDPEGHVEGVRAVSGEEQRAPRADAVVLASGGFGGNPELVRSYIIGGSGRMRLRANPWSTGDGFLAALEAGALASAGLDEFYGRNLPAPTARQPGLRAWYVIDAAGLQERVRDRTVEEMVTAARRLGATVLRAESLKELAEKLAERGVSQENVLHGLSEYNAAVADGRADKLSPPRSAPATPVQVPPFVAVAVAPTITHTIGGLAVDAGCRVLRRTDGRPLPGLYAAGAEVGGVSTGGYTSGLAAALVFGRVAAVSAVRDSKSSTHGRKLGEDP